MRIVVVGASLGGVEALQSLAAGLPENFSAPVFVVLHIDGYRSSMPEILSRCGPLPATHAVDGETFHPGRIYLAPPDHHMLLEATTIRTVKGPKQNHVRPAVDPLFRSAALVHGTAVIAIVLTGKLDDGAAGLRYVHDLGGLTVVQDPKDAFAPEMPTNALARVPAHFCVPLKGLPALLGELVGSPAPQLHDGNLDTASEAVAEQAIFDHKGDPLAHLQRIARPSMFTCPDCQGALWALRGDYPERFVCHTGHTYGFDSLEHAYASKGNEAIWATIRALQERLLLLKQRMAALQGVSVQSTHLDWPHAAHLDCNCAPM